MALKEFMAKLTTARCIEVVQTFRVRQVIGSELQELELKVQMEKEFAHRGAKQVRAIKDSDEKVVALERTLQGFVEDFEKERAHMRQQWEKAAADMAAEVDGYRRLAEVRFGAQLHGRAPAWHVERSGGQGRRHSEPLVFANSTSVTHHSLQGYHAVLASMIESQICC